MNGDKNKIIRAAAIIAVAGNAVLSSLKIIAGLFSRSQALLSDGVDSLADVLISVMTLVIVKIMSKPADREHPWGYGRAETVATAFLAFIIFFAGAQVIINAAPKLFSFEGPPAPSAAAIIVTVISIVGKLLLAFSQFILGRRADSALVTANAKNMASDVLISTGVLAGLAISVLTGVSYADTLIAVLIGLWIIRTAIGIFLEANLELMDGINDMEPYRVIVDAVNATDGASNPHRARIRRIAGLWSINFDINVNAKYSVLKAHRIASRVEKEIKRNLENLHDIVIHIEPEGDNAIEEYGLSQSDIE